MSQLRTITVAFTGASGLPYGVRLVECLLKAGCRVWLLYSQVAQIVARQEMGWALPSRAAEVEAELSARFQAAPGQLKVLAGKNGSRHRPRVPIRPKRWWCVRARWPRWPRLPAG